MVKKLRATLGNPNCGQYPDEKSYDFEIKPLVEISDKI